MKTLLKTLDVRTRARWRRWLSRHHASESAVWLVFHKRHTGVKCLGYEESVEEALCFGWIDSLIRRLDEDRYARKFTPRKPDSIWSEINRKRYARLKAGGLLEPAGVERAPSPRRYPPQVLELPAGIASVLRKSPSAWKRFEALPASRRRAYVSWVVSAKREETRQRRLRELMEVLEAGKSIGMK